MFFVLVGGAVHEDGVWNRRRSKAEDVMGVLRNLDRKRWRGGKRVVRAGRGTRRVSALKA